MVIIKCSEDPKVSGDIEEPMVSSCDNPRVLESGIDLTSDAIESWINLGVSTANDSDREDPRVISISNNERPMVIINNSEDPMVSGNNEEPIVSSCDNPRVLEPG